MTEAQKKSCRNWAINHKDKINENNRRWRQNNKKKFNEIVLRRRKEVARELKEKGMMFVYLPRTQRELKTINYVMRKLKINEDEARQILIDSNWNVKEIMKQNL